jgi:hypothetical protein
MSSYQSGPRSAGILAALLVVSCAAGARAQEASPPPAPVADPRVEAAKTREESLGEAAGLVKKDGWGAAALANVGAFRANGAYQLFSAGIGVGVSYKHNTARRRYPFELGLYAAPQLTGGKGSSAASAAAILHATLFKSFGIGVGWETGRATVDGEGGAEGGFFKSGAKDSFFVTLGLGLTNTSGE